MVAENNNCIELGVIRPLTQYTQGLYDIIKMANKCIRFKLLKRLYKGIMILEVPFGKSVWFISLKNQIISSEELFPKITQQREEKMARQDIFSH